MNTPRIGIYRHFKGGVYELLFIALHSETLEQMVIYRSVQEPQKVWARPLSMWNETVEHDGRQVPRFTLLKSESTENTAPI